MTIHQGIESTTWHDQRPTHAKMSNAEFDARRAEDEAWKIYSDYSDEICGKLEPITQAEYRQLEHLRLVAEQASRNLSQILHAKHHGAALLTEE